jgi:multidrug efflux pump
MTGITTAAGAVPLILAFGAGAETRFVIGTVVFSGVIAATAFTLFVVPVAYALLARRTGSPGDVERRLNSELAAPVAKRKPVAEVNTADRPAAE